MIRSVRLQNIRSFKDSAFNFQEGINLIIGANGAGKTTLLETIGLFAYGKFLSIPKDIYALTRGESVGRIEAEFFSPSGRAEMGFSSSEKLIKINGQKAPVSDLIGLLPQVFFNVVSVELVSDAPVLRRRELDFILTQVDHAFVLDILNYRKVLKERNALLRLIQHKHSKINEIEFWNQKLSEYARKVFIKRAELIEFYSSRIGQVFKNLRETQENLTLKYHESADYSRFDEFLEARQELDILNGATSIGPHRDDFSFILGKQDMKEGASRGEQRLCAVAFKAVACEFLLSRQKDPIIVLDDVFSELDETGREAVANTLGLFEGIKQVFVSATDEKVIPVFLKQKANLIRL